ncbi:MAG: CarD family transcriptional regulator [Lachnospiraceae bacterium]|nr:CarD family transcriptional regulator [Lachnospiraceae bacterium]
MCKIEINDAVVHVPEGVCTVTSIIERDLASLGVRRYYVLVPVYDRRSKIFVPIEGDAQKVRELPDREEVLSLIDGIPESESVWVDNDKARLESFSSILSRCDHKEMMSLVHTLKDKQSEKKRTGKKFHSADERIFREAERILFGEFGYVLGIAPGEVGDFIKNRLETSSQAQA